MKTLAQFRNTESFNMLIGVAAVLALGFGTATAAISTAPRDDINPAMRALATGPSLHVQRAFTEDDEDCTYVTSKVMQPNGKLKIVRKLECADEH